MQASATPTFRAGDALNWREVSGDTATVRGVEFCELSSETTAVVRFGGGRLVVPLSSLSPMEPAKPPWFIGEFQKPRPEPVPPTETQLESRLAEARAALASRHEHAKEMQERVTTAKQVCDRAGKELEQARSALRVLQADDRRLQLAAEDALRHGQVMPQPNGHDRSYVEQRVAIAEAAVRHFDTELSTANAALADALSAVRVAAAATLSVILSKHVELLRGIETLAATSRAELVDTAAWWPSSETGPLMLGRATAQYLEVQPPWQEQQQVRFHSAESRTRVWRELYSNLLVDASADFVLDGGE